MLPRQPALLACLAAAVCGSLGAWWVCTGSRSSRSRATAVDDDVEMMATLLDGGWREPTRDLLVAGARELYLARAADRSIVAVAKSGGTPRILVTFDAPVRGMALAGPDLWVTTGHAVVKVPLAGGGHRTIADGLAQPRAIAADGRSVFFVDVDADASGLLHKSVVVRVPPTGGEATVLGRSDGEVTNVALDDTAVYWADRLEGTILSVQKTGGEPRPLATERGLPGQLVVDGDALVWVEKRSESLWTMPKTGGSPRRIAQDFAGFSDVVVDARGVWWTSEAAVNGAFRVLTAPKTGGDPVAASPAVNAIDALASDGARLFWARDGLATPVDPVDAVGDR